MNSVDASVTPDPTGRIAPGMPVIDTHGEQVGTIALVRPADQNAVAVEGAVDPGDAIGDELPHPETGDEPAAAPDVAARLLRTGFIKVSATEPDGVGYVGVDQIAAVEAGVVRLAIARSEVTPPA